MFKKDYVKTQSGEGKIYRILSNATRIKNTVNRLPLKYTDSEYKREVLNRILVLLDQLENEIETLKRLQR